MQAAQLRGVRRLTWPLDLVCHPVALQSPFFADRSEDLFSLNCLPRANSARCRLVYGPRCVRRRLYASLAGYTAARACCNGHAFAYYSGDVAVRRSRVPEFLFVLFGARAAYFLGALTFLHI